MILKLLAVAGAALLLAGPAAAACAHPRTSLFYLEGQVMCPTCHTTLDQSDAPAAERIKAYIQTRIDQCATNQQIEASLVANFGAGILAAPSHKGFDLLAWWLPIAGVVLGGLLLAFGVWRWSRNRDLEAPAGGSHSLNRTSPAALDPETERRLDELLAGLD